jgi:PPOX class probable F420-dependent enzyme
MLGTPEQDAFINSQKWASVTTLRADGSPANSIIFFAREGDTLFFSTTESRLKTKTLRRDPRINVCVLDEGAPYRFVSVEGTATIEDQDVVPGHIEINRVMRGDRGWQPPEGFAERLKNDGRVIVKVNATRVSGVVNR